MALLGNSAGAVPDLDLPAYQWWSEALHGVAYSPGVTFDAATPWATVFPQVSIFPHEVQVDALGHDWLEPRWCPQVITTSHAFNLSLVHSIAAAISTEARAFSNAGHAGLTFWSVSQSVREGGSTSHHPHRHTQSGSTPSALLLITPANLSKADMEAAFCPCVLNTHCLALPCSSIFCLPLLLLRAPNINIFRDPRWGRGHETPGEDPYWNGQYAAAFVKGMQEGDDHKVGGQGGRGRQGGGGSAVEARQGVTAW